MSESLTALFDTVDLVRHPVPGLIERVPLDQLELAPNHRKAINEEGIHRLADMHDVAPELTQAVAARVSTSELHDQALRDLGGFVHRTVVEDERVYAVRIDDGVLLDAAEQLEHARRHLSAERHAEAAAALGCETDKLDSELDALAARARSGALKLRVDATLRDRAANGRYGWVFERGQDFAAGIWVIDPTFMIDAVRQQLADENAQTVREETYFGGARLDDPELRDAAEDDRLRRRLDRRRTPAARGRHRPPRASPRRRNRRR